MLSLEIKPFRINFKLIFYFLNNEKSDIQKSKFVQIFFFLQKAGDRISIKSGSWSPLWSFWSVEILVLRQNSVPGRRFELCRTSRLRLLLLCCRSTFEQSDIFSEETPKIRFHFEGRKKSFKSWSTDAAGLRPSWWRPQLCFRTRSGGAGPPGPRSIHSRWTPRCGSCTTIPRSDAWPRRATNDASETLRPSRWRRFSAMKPLLKICEKCLGTLNSVQRADVLWMISPAFRPHVFIGDLPPHLPAPVPRPSNAVLPYHCPVAETRNIPTVAR